MEHTPKQPYARAQGAIEWMESLSFATALLILVFLFLVRAATVSGTSMVPTLNSGDKILVQGVNYAPQHGDVIVVDGYNNYGEPIVKRVIGLAGDTVNIDFDTATVWVNGEKLNEPYLGTPTQRAGDVTFPVTVPAGEVFVLGDNRNNSEDSRYADMGNIKKRNIIGKVWFIASPWSRFGFV